MTQINIKRFFKNWGSPLGHALFFIVVTSAVASGFVQAAEINATAKLSWETPTTNVLGLPIKPESIVKYELYWGTAPNKLTNKINLIPPTNAYNWSATLPADADGGATAYFAILARNASPDPGLLSAVVSKRFVLDGSSAPPAPPGNVIVVTAGCTAPPGWTCKVEPAP